MGMTAEVANVDQARAWDGDEGEHWTEFEDHYNAGVRRHDAYLHAGAGIGARDHVLDVGCGCGLSTRDAARAATSGSALGVDLSARMLERARERARAEGLTNVTFEQVDAQVHPFTEAAFDVAISRFGAMFFADPVAAFANIGRAVRPGGRLAQLAWQEFGKNEWLQSIAGALAAGRTLPSPPPGSPGPFGLADPDGVRRILSQAGFRDVQLTEVNEPIQLGTDSEDSFRFLSGVGIVKGLLDDLDQPTRAAALDNLRDAIATHETGEGVLFGSAAWLITATRE